MSFIHTGSIEVRTVNGRLQFTGTSETHAVTGWDAVKAESNAQARIPAQRSASAYDTHLLATNGGDPR